MVSPGSPREHRETPEPAENAAPALSADDLLAEVQTFVNETRAPGAGKARAALASRLDRDLGIDSLGRTELSLRLERRFGVALSLEKLNEADTVGDLLAAFGVAKPLRTEAATGPAVLGEAAPAYEAATLNEVLDWHAGRHPDRLHLTVLEDASTVIATLTYRELRERARRVAAALVERRIEPGDRVALMLPTSADFFVAFFGVLYAGAAPVPIYPPGRLSQIEDHLRRQAGILRNAGVKQLITVPEGRRLAGLFGGTVESLAGVATVEDLAGADETVLPPGPPPAATALIQYTSGSTGDPKGVVLSHANILANLRAMTQAMEADTSDVFVSWLPLYHDMGLIGAWLGPLHHAVPTYLMSPLAFLGRPENWLWAIHRFRGTLSASPNFGFDLCLNKIDGQRIAGLDLSSLRMVVNGSEPIYPKNLRRFVERFGAYGFPREAMAPAYGLAESTVGLAFPPPGRGPVIDRIDAEALTVRGLAVPATEATVNVREIVACGLPLPGHQIRIVDGTGREVADRVEGRLQFRGPSSTSGYFGNPEATKALIRGDWHESGDRAYLAGGDVHITGRIKDIIIRAGRNLYPQEVENEVGRVDGVRKGGVVMFGADDPAAGTEQLVVVAETSVTEPAAAAALEDRIRDVATGILGAPPDRIVLAKPQTIPKTSSGKLRRSAAKALYEEGALTAATRSVRWQIARFALLSASARLRRGLRAAGTALYAGWWWLVVGLAAILGWAAVMTLPSTAARWSAVRALSRAAVALLAVRFTRTGAEAVPSTGAVLVFNHASYIDPILLSAALPGEPAFVAKRELAGHALAGPAIRRLGGIFVERFDLSGSLADADEVLGAIRAGRLVVVFPEGTFTREPGLAAFRLGAFRAAVDAGAPVIPGVLHGTRSMMRGDQWWPRRTEIGVTIGAPIRAEGEGYEAAAKLRDAARAFMLKHLDEPDRAELLTPTRPA